ncbi:YCF48-related protein [Rhodonellum sp.]|uniref:WD40/YVTN/BNR-like repeat-containing protein n=1 Tax=Rhodonellum sp. TaxID=2231180 RepID=UPI002728EBB9|nr:YCF48-related protein [Rhodonellum sp.]MDO9554388.1 YCF48-related protein [Rhodonellum sp.]
MRLFSFLFLSMGVLAFNSCQQKENSVILERPTGWEIIETPTQASLRGLSPVTNEIVWASGSSGVWLLTVDGGDTWETGVIGGLDTVDFRDIEGFSASTALALSSGQPAVIFKTIDGGKNWVEKFKGPEGAFFDGFDFNKDKNGYVIGDPVGGKWMVLRTNDQGETWALLESSPKAKEGEAAFAASGSGIIMGTDNIWFASGGSISRVYNSNDGGSKWTVQDTPILQGEMSQGIYSITRVDNDNMIAVGGDYLQPDFSEKNVILSNDLGKTWTAASGNPPSGYRSGVAYFPRHHWVITVGPNGGDFSKDGGYGWERFSDEAFHSVYLDKSQSGVWASGANGKIAKLKF